MDALAQPRNGILKKLKTSNPRQMGQVIFWSSLRSLGLAVGIKRNGFKNDPRVAGELVKFLAVNTGFESIKNLQAQVASLQEDLVTARRDTAAATKSAASASNKADKALKQSNALVKRVEKLKKK